MSTPKSKHRITQTLLSNWLYAFKTEDGYEKFVKCLNREKEPATDAMLNGVKFEGMVNATLDGATVPADHEWRECVEWCADYLRGSQKQVTIFRDIKVGDTDYVLHGVLDFLRCGEIFDTKFSKTYHRGKYLTSPQTAMYFALVPEAYRFEYVVCDGKYVYREDYRPGDVEPIKHTIAEFERWLKQHNLWNTYTEKWSINR